MKTPSLAFALVMLQVIPMDSPAQSRSFSFPLLSQDSDTLDQHDRVMSFIEEVLKGVEERINAYSTRKQLPSSEDDSDSVRTSIRSEDGALTFTGDTEINSDDRIDGNIVVKGGTLTVAGTVSGDALVINGDVVVKDGGRITGNVRTMNGKIIREGNGVIEGITEEGFSAANARHSKRDVRPRMSYTFNEFWLEEHLFPDNLVFRYNRVEGLFLGFGAEKKFYWDGRRMFSGYGSAGYGFKIHRWRMNLGIDRQFPTENGLYEIGAEGHSLTDTKDSWIINLAENNTVALLWHEDYRDYYSREGFSVHSARYSKEPQLSTQFRIEYIVDRYSSLTKMTDWSLFRPSHSFRDNPLVWEGIMHSALIKAGVSTLERPKNQLCGWNAFASAEFGGSQLGGDFDFTQVIVDIRRFQPLSRYDNINMRLRVGALEGDYLPQKSFEIGGANTMPAYAFKEFGGNRMILGNFEYTMSGRLFDDIFLWPTSLNLIVFTDAGVTRTAVPRKSFYEGFDSIRVRDVKSDIGFALGWHDGTGRLGFAWRTDRRESVSIFLRFSKPF